MQVMGLLRQGSYVDSIALMQIAEELQCLAGIETATVVMGTPANLATLGGAKLRPPEADGAGPNDLVVAVRAKSAEAGRAALKRAEVLLANRGRAGAVINHLKERDHACAGVQSRDARSRRHRRGRTTAGQGGLPRGARRRRPRQDRGQRRGERLHPGAGDALLPDAHRPALGA